MIARAGASHVENRLQILGSIRFDLRKYDDGTFQAFEGMNRGAEYFTSGGRPPISQLVSGCLGWGTI